MDLLVSVMRKNTSKPSRVLFLVEHKSQHAKKLIIQLLRYLIEIYDDSLDPVIVVLINQSPNKVWKGPLNFHDHLQNFDGEFREVFKDFVLFFKFFVLNVGALRIPRDTKGLTIEPIAYTMQNIRGIDFAKLVKAFRLCKKLIYSERKKAMGYITNYVQRYDSRVKKKDIIDAEKKAVKKKEDRVMMTIIEEAEHKGLQTGLQQGLQTGRMERDQEVILNMLKENMDMASISRVTGMPEKEIKKLKNGS